METEQLQTALRYLAREPLLHMSMTAPLTQGNAELLYAGTDGVLLCEQKSGAYMLSVATEQAGECLAALIPGEADLLAAHQRFSAEHLQKRFKLGTAREYLQAVYLAKTSLPLSGCMDIRVLDLEYLPLVLEHYHVVEDPVYVRARIEEGALYGGFVAGELAGFTGLHSEGSIGFLMVLPGFRRRGYAAELQSYIVNMLLEAGLTPFGQILPDNIGSLELHRKLGFTFSPGRMYWLF